MNILRKNLLIFLCVSLFSSAILCMQEDQGESEKLLILYATWKDKKEVILEYVEKAKQSRQNEDYCEKGKKLATFLPDGHVRLYSDDFEDSGPSEFLLACIEAIKKKELSNESTPLLKKNNEGIESKKRCILY
jgi:hypothetical protein